MPKFAVLKVIDGKEGFMATYTPQVAMIHEYDSAEDAATFNVGTYPEYDERGHPYRVVVVPAEAWKEFEVFAESKKGERNFVAYPSENPTLRQHSDR